jgi:hypothetical protein
MGDTRSSMMEEDIHGIIHMHIQNFKNQTYIYTHSSYEKKHNWRNYTIYIEKQKRKF